jgi:hypothetical protein
MTVIGAQRVETRKLLFEIEFVHELAIEPVAIAGAVIAIDAADGGLAPSARERYTREYESDSFRIDYLSSCWKSSVCCAGANQG